jgi:hypothetical protein
MKVVVQMVELMHAISIYEAWASGTWRMTFGWLNFVCTTCLMKESVRTETPYRLDGCNCFPITVSETETLLLVEHWMASGRYCHVRPNGFTWTLDSSRTLKSGRMICHYVWTNATLNSLKFLDIDGVRTVLPRRPHGCCWLIAFGRFIESFGRKLGIRLLWVGIYTESSLNTEIAFLQLVTLELVIIRLFPH